MTDWGEHVLLHHADHLAWAYSFAGPLAQDVLAETYLRVLDKSPANAGGFVRGVAKRVYKEVVKDRVRQREIAQRLRPFTFEVEPEILLIPKGVRRLGRNPYVRPDPTPEQRERRRERERGAAYKSAAKARDQRYRAKRQVRAVPVPEARAGA